MGRRAERADRVIPCRTGARRAGLRADRHCYDFARTSAPVERNGRYFFTRNTGLQNQPVLYVQEGIAGDAARPARSQRAQRRRHRGAHRARADRGRRLAGLRPVAQRQRSCRRSTSATSRTGERSPRPPRLGEVHDHQLDRQTAAGFYYTRFPRAGHGARRRRALLLRRLLSSARRSAGSGPRWSSTGRTAAKLSSMSMLQPTTTAASSSRPSRDRATRARSYLLDLSAAGRHSQSPLFTGFDAAYTFIDSRGRPAVLPHRPGRAARRGSSPSQSNAPAPDPQVIVPNRRTSCRLRCIAADRLVAAFLHDASDQLRLFRLDGEPRRRGAAAGHRIDLRPGRPTGPRRGCSSDSRRSPTRQPVSAIDLESRDRWPVRGRPSGRIDPAALRDVAGLVPSKDGTRVLDVPGPPPGPAAGRQAAGAPLRATAASTSA